MNYSTQKKQRHPRQTLRALMLFTVASLLGVFCSNAQSVPLPPGSTNLSLYGTTSAAEPDLAGVVLADQDISFTGLDYATGATAITGTLQDRVVQETLTGDLDFYGRITSANFGDDLAAIDSIGEGNYEGFSLNVNYRTDGLGEVGPNAASRSSDGSEVAWYFESPSTLGEQTGIGDSLFFFAQTNATSFDSNGSARIVDYNLKTKDGQLNPTINLSGLYEPVPAPEPLTSALLLGALSLLVGGLRLARFRSDRIDG